MDWSNRQEHGNPCFTTSSIPLIHHVIALQQLFHHLSSWLDSVLVHWHPSPLLSHCSLHVAVICKSHFPGFCYIMAHPTLSSSLLFATSWPLQHYHFYLPHLPHYSSHPSVRHIMATHTMHGTSASPFNSTHCQHPPVCQKAQDVKAVAGKRVSWV